MRKALGSNPSVSIGPLNRLQPGNIGNITNSWVPMARHRRISTWIRMQKLKRLDSVHARLWVESLHFAMQLVWSGRKTHIQSWLTGLVV